VRVVVSRFTSSFCPGLRHQRLFALQLHIAYQHRVVSCLSSHSGVITVGTWSRRHTGQLLLPHDVGYGFLLATELRTTLLLRLGVSHLGLDSTSQDVSTYSVLFALSSGLAYAVSVRMTEVRRAAGNVPLLPIWPLPSRGLDRADYRVSS
jgi:hypothetical protein